MVTEAFLGILLGFFVRSGPNTRLETEAKEDTSEGQGGYMIIAVDFDGILCEDNGTFPAIGPPIYSMIQFVKELVKQGHEVVLWTSRTDKALEDAIEWCNKFGLKFCAINENAPSNVAKYSAKYPNGTRKVSADVYIDDHNPAFAIDKLTINSEYAIDSIITTTRRYLRWVSEN